ncbi:MAG: PIG-L family deacetylase [Balneolaceae bacterium]
MGKKILYIFPHPDDESFGPAPAISAQLGQGHEVYLLTLTRGEATKQRHRLGISKEEMGQIRYEEMLCVEKTLGLSGMTVLNLPDSELKHMEPRKIEDSIEEEIKKIEPDVIVTYAVHGVSGFHDHLVCHAVVKNLFCRMKQKGGYHPARLALFTRMGDTYTKGKFMLSASTDEEIAYIEECSTEDMKAFHNALDCYETYQQVIEDSHVKELTTNQVPFEIFDESYSEPLASLTDRLPE